jgi:hypothetical protein
MANVAAAAVGLLLSDARMDRATIACVRIRIDFIRLNKVNLVNLSEY